MRDASISPHTPRLSLRTTIQRAASSHIGYLHKLTGIMITQSALFAATNYFTFNQMHLANPSYITIFRAFYLPHSVALLSSLPNCVRTLFCYFRSHKSSQSITPSSIQSCLVLDDDILLTDAHKLTACSRSLLTASAARATPSSFSFCVVHAEVAFISSAFHTSLRLSRMNAIWRSNVSSYSPSIDSSSHTSFNILEGSVMIRGARCVLRGIVERHIEWVPAGTSCRA